MRSLHVIIKVYDWFGNQVGSRGGWKWSRIRGTWINTTQLNYCQRWLHGTSLSFRVGIRVRRVQMRQSPWFGQRIIWPCLIWSRYDLTVDTFSCVRWIDSQSINERGMSLLSNYDRRKYVYCQLMNGESSEIRIESTMVEQRRGSHWDHPHFHAHHITPNSRNPKPGCVNRTWLLFVPSPFTLFLRVFANIKFEHRQANKCQCYLLCWKTGRHGNRKSRFQLVGLLYDAIHSIEMRLFVTWNCFMKPFLCWMYRTLPIL